VGDAIKLFVNDEEVEFTAIKLDNLELHCRDVNGRYPTPPRKRFLKGNYIVQLNLDK